jgi:hypothetical protein
LKQPVTVITQTSLKEKSFRRPLVVASAVCGLIALIFFVVEGALLFPEAIQIALPAVGVSVPLFIRGSERWERTICAVGSLVTGFFVVGWALVGGITFLPSAYLLFLAAIMPNLTVAERS